MSTVDIARDILAILTEWDPEGLIEIGAPSDEYTCEANALAHCRHRIHDERSAAEEIALVFTYYFDHGGAYTPEECTEVGARVWAVFKRESDAWGAEMQEAMRAIAGEASR